MDISVVIPAYNREATLGRSIQSVADQTYKPKEIIVVDDGSTDDTPAVCDEYGHRLDNLRTIRTENNGASVARNTGIRAALGEWVAFLDSDDVWYSGYLDAVEKTHSKCPLADLYFADLEINLYGDMDRLWRKSDVSPVSSKPLTNTALLELAMLPFQPLMLQSSVFRKESLLKIGLFRNDLFLRQDTHLFFKAAISGCTAAAVDALAGFMTDDGGSRLTKVISSETEPYRNETIVMYRDLLMSVQEKINNNGSADREPLKKLVKVLRRRLYYAFRHDTKASLLALKFLRATRSGFLTAVYGRSMRN